MMKKLGKVLIKNRGSIFVFLVSAILSFLLLTQMITPAKSLLDLEKSNLVDTSHMNMKILAIGDSLTEGVGDDTNSGGYVPLLVNGLDDVYHFNSIEAYNYGKSGNKTTQVTKRIKDSKEIQKKIADSDMIVITIGANDLMKTVKANILKDISVHTFDKPRDEYTKNLNVMYETIRKYNKKCPIYQLGIYNPFYLSFQDIVEMQDVVDKWNLTTETNVRKQKNMYFVPINDQIYQGLQHDSASSTQNNLLSEEDSFHPNNTGYQIIANAFSDKIKETQQAWVSKK